LARAVGQTEAASRIEQASDAREGERRASASGASVWRSWLLASAARSRAIGSLLRFGDVCRGGRPSLPRRG
jgi:hypothetical protein